MRWAPSVSPKSSARSAIYASGTLLTPLSLEAIAPLEAPRLLEADVVSTAITTSRSWVPQLEKKARCSRKSNLGNAILSPGMIRVSRAHAAELPVLAHSRDPYMLQNSADLQTS